MINTIESYKLGEIRTHFKTITQEVGNILTEDKIDNYIDNAYKRRNKDEIKRIFHESERTFTEKEVKLILNNQRLVNLLEDKLLKKYDSNDIEMIGNLFPPESDYFLTKDIFEQFNEIKNYKTILKSINDELGEIIQENSGNEKVLNRIHQGILATLTEYTN